MASGSQTRLSRLLLQRSDRHPVARIDGVELASFDPRVVDRFINEGFLIEQEPLLEVDGLVLQEVDGAVTAISIDGDQAAAVISSKAVQQFEIDLVRLAKEIRASNRLAGAPVEAVGPKLLWLGAVGTGSRRQEFYLARAVRGPDALNIALITKGRSVGGSVVLITPTERNLPNSVLKQLQAENVAIVAAADVLHDDADEPFRLKLPVIAATAPKSDGDERLVVDVEGMRATLDGIRLDLARREFNVLRLLAVELMGTNGIVSRESISETIREVTGNDETLEEQIDKSISIIRREFANATRSGGGAPARLIQTVRHVGYHLMLPPEAVRIF